MLAEDVDELTAVMVPCFQCMGKRVPEWRVISEQLGFVPAESPKVKCGKNQAEW